MATRPKAVSQKKGREFIIKSLEEPGHYSNENECIDDPIKEEKGRKARLNEIREALTAGERSGISKRTPEEIRQAVKQRLREEGKL